MVENSRNPRENEYNARLLLLLSKRKIVKRRLNFDNLYIYIMNLKNYGLNILIFILIDD